MWIFIVIDYGRFQIISLNSVNVKYANTYNGCVLRITYSVPIIDPTLSRHKVITSTVIDRRTFWALVIRKTVT